MLVNGSDNMAVTHEIICQHCGRKHPSYYLDPVAWCFVCFTRFSKSHPVALQVLVDP